MATAWTLTRERLADKSLEHCGVLGVGKVPAYEDRGLALETLDGMLKELPIYGYSWPKVANAQASLSLVAATNPTALPSDYYGSLMPNLLDFYKSAISGLAVSGIAISGLSSDGDESPFRLITLSEWNAISDKDYAAEYPDRGYIDPSRKLWTWPVQSATRTLKVFYQKVIDDTVASASPDISVPFLMGLAYGIAANIGDAFGVAEKKLQRFEAKWSVARGRGINADVPLAPIRIEALE